MGSIPIPRSQRERLIASGDPAQPGETSGEGLAALEKARGERAALRKLANAARLIDKNPNLMQFRLLHSLGESNAGALVVNLSAAQPPGAPVQGPPVVEPDDD